MLWYGLAALLVQAAQASTQTYIQAKRACCCDFYHIAGCGPGRHQAGAAACGCRQWSWRYLHCWPERYRQVSTSLLHHSRGHPMREEEMKDYLCQCLERHPHSNQISGQHRLLGYLHVLLAHTVTGLLCHTTCQLQVCMLCYHQ